MLQGARILMVWRELQGARIRMALQCGMTYASIWRDNAARRVHPDGVTTRHGVCVRTVWQCGMAHAFRQCDVGTLTQRHMRRMLGCRLT